MRFVARVGAPDGRVFEETFQAATEESARDRLTSKGYHIFELRKRGMSLSGSDGRKFFSRRGKITDQEFLLFNQELASLMKAGLPLLQTLDLLLERQRNALFREILNDVRDRVRSGEELSDAFLSYREHFPPLYPSSLKAGERSGELETVIRRFIRYLTLVMDTKKKVVSALIYPVVLISLAAVMVAVMLVVVIPKFRTFFEAVEVELPWITQQLITTSEFLRGRGGFVLLVATILGAFVMRQWSQTETGREWLDAAKLRLPLAGNVLHRFSLSEFCRSLGTLLSGGLPLVPSLEVSVGAMGNSYLRSRLAPVVEGVREGKALHEALQESGVFTDLGIDMVKVGEATGALDEMLNNVSDFFDEEIETKIQRLLSLVEPIMLLLMGLSVAGLLLAMYLPLFTMLSQLQ